MARPRKRQSSWANPFLSRPKQEITCEDCGLDFEPAAISEPARSSSSGRFPWNRG